MADSFTPEYNFDLPEVSSSNGTWGTKNNANWSAIDTDLKAVSDAADAAQAAADAAQDTADAALAGGAAIVPTAITLAGGDPYTGTVDLDLNSAFSITQTSSFAATDCNLTFTNRPATESRIIYLKFVITVTSGVGAKDFVVKFNSTQKLWAIPMQVPVANTGSSLTVTTLSVAASGTQTYVVPVYIIAGV